GEARRARTDDHAPCCTRNTGGGKSQRGGDSIDARGHLVAAGDGSEGDPRPSTTIGVGQRGAWRNGTITGGYREEHRDAGDRSSTRVRNEHASWHRQGARNQSRRWES